MGYMQADSEVLSKINWQSYPVEDAAFLIYLLSESAHHYTVQQALMMLADYKWATREPDGIIEEAWD